LRRGAAGLIVAGAALLGALIGSCETVDLGSPPRDVNACRPSQQVFADDIWPNVLSADYGGKHCYDAKCHDPASGRPLTLIANPQPPTSPPVPLVDDWGKNYRSATEQMNCSNVSSSALIIYPANLTLHGGGMLFSATGPEALKIQTWVNP
jgi:hypothetical protein